MNAPLPPPDEGGLTAPPGLGFWGRLAWWLKFWLYAKTARLRFIAVLVAVGGAIAYWDTLQAYFDKWARPAAAHAEAAAGLEFWCPMHPTVIRDHPDKCPICAMPLSKRKKGEKSEDDALPPGIVSRVQLTPYRIALAGVETAEVQYRPLRKEIRTVGFVEFDERRLARITARVTGKSRIDKLYVNVTGQVVHAGDPVADLYSPDLVVTVQNLLDARRSGNGQLERSAQERLRLWGVDDQQMAEIVKSGKPVTHLTIRAPISGHIIKKYQTVGEYVEEGARLFDVASLSTVWIEAQV
jgi:Cu(I)/Ag(I) efflux system membrane fusion protein